MQGMSWTYTCSNAPVTESESDESDYQRSFLDAFEL